MPKLSPLHIQLRDFILQYQQSLGTRPTYKEMAEALGINRMTAFRYIKRLEMCGEIKRPMYITR